MPTFYSGPGSTLLNPFWEEHISKLSAAERQKILEASRFQRTPPGLLHTLSQMGRPSALTGLLFDPLKAFTQQAASSALNIGQATLPTGQDLHKIPGFDTATEALGLEVDPYISAESAGGLGKATAQRAARVGNALTLGMSDSLLRRLGSTIPKGLANPVTGESGEVLPALDQAALFGRGAVTHAAMDLLPGEEASRLLTGERADGTPLTPREVGSLVTSAALKTAIAKKILPGTQSSQLRRNMGVQSSKKLQLRSNAEIEATGLARDQRLAELAQQRQIARATAKNLGISPTKVPSFVDNRFVDHETQALTQHILPPKVRQAFKDSMDTTLFNPDELSLIGQEVIKSDIFSDLYERTLHADKYNIKKNLQDKQTPYTAVAAKAIEEGALKTNTLQHIAKIHDLPPARLASNVAEIYSKTMKFSAQSLETAREGSMLAFNELSQGVLKGDKSAIKQWLRLKRIHNKSGALSMFETYSDNAVRHVEKVRLASLLMQPATMMRNVTVQGANFLNQIVEHLNSGAIEMAYGKGMGEVRPTSSYFADVIGDFTSFYDNFKAANLTRTPGASAKAKANREIVRQIINENPIMALDLMGADMFEIGHEVLGSLFNLRDLKGPRKAYAKIKQAHELGISYSDIYANILTTGTRIQEQWFRKLFFESALRGNMERIGLKDFTQLLEEVKKPKMREDVRGALIDAWTNSKKQTFSHAPEGGPFKTILDFYHRHPSMTAIGIPFPRFTMNVFRWLYEHNPDMMFEAFTPEVKKVLYEGAAGGFKNRDAARMLGKSMDGLMLLGTAYSIRNSELAGPKYFQIKTPQGMTDTRSDLPFTTALGLAEAISLAQKNIPWDEAWTPIYSANEIGDMLLNVRSVSEVGALSFVDVLRSFGTYDPDTIQKALLTPAGQWLSGFLMPGKFANDVYAMVSGDPKARETKLLEGHEFLGPIVQNIPGLRNTLEPKYSPTTGLPESPTRFEHALRTIIGINLNESPLLEQVLFSVPGLKYGELAGKHKNPSATNLVRKHMGTKFSEPVSADFVNALVTRIEPGDPAAFAGAKTFGDMLALLATSTYKDSQGVKRPLAPKQITHVLQKIMEPVREEAEARAMLENPKVFREDFLEKLKKLGPLSDYVGLHTLGAAATDEMIRIEAQQTLTRLQGGDPTTPPQPTEILESLEAQEP